MNKFFVILLAVLGGINAAIDLFIPIIIMRLWVVYNDSSLTTSILLYSLGGLASIFRGIKTGWLKK
jgi:hypothetical protein